jgi:hypothetical protein
MTGWKDEETGGTVKVGHGENRGSVSESALSDGVSLRDCMCDGWRRYMNYLTNQQVVATMKGLEYPEGGEFMYCPWCGKKREVN